MENRMTASRFAFVFILLIVGLLTRFIPHWPNLTAVGAVALLGAAHLKPKWIAPAITLGILFLSDLVLGYYNGFGLVYAAFLIMSFQGLFMKANSRKSLLIHSVSGSILFFLITNFGVWSGSGLYTKDFIGLLSCYAAGLPFLVNFILGTVLFGLGIQWLIRLAEERFFVHA